MKRALLEYFPFLVMLDLKTGEGEMHVVKFRRIIKLSLQIIYGERSIELTALNLCVSCGKCVNEYIQWVR